MHQDIWNSWWMWIAAGFSLGVLEILAPGYIFVGFALGAVLVGLLMATGLMAGAGLPVTLVVFAVLSLASWLVLRRLMGTRQGQKKIWHRDINDER